MTLIFSPPSTITLALAVLCSIGSNRRAALAEDVERAVGQARHQQAAQRQRELARQLRGDRLDHRPDGGRHVDRQTPPVEARQQPPELAHGAVAYRQRAVPGAAAEGRARPADLLLGDHDRIEAPAGELHRETAELADRVAHAGEQLGVLADEEVRPVVAAGLLVGEHAQDHVPGRGRGAASARMKAASIIATPPFMSSAPRPQT